MRISATEEYGLRCMLVLARRGADTQCSISDVAEAEGISTPYASKLLGILRRSGLVDASRGRHGGFSLTRQPDEISLLDVLTSLGGPLIDPDHCSKRTGQLVTCVHGTHCSVHDVIGGLAMLVTHVLSNTSLQQVIDGNLPTLWPGLAVQLPVIGVPSNDCPNRIRKTLVTEDKD